MHLKRGGTGTPLRVSSWSLYRDPLGHYRLILHHDAVGGAVTTTLDLSREELARLTGRAVEELARPPAAQRRR